MKKPYLKKYGKVAHFKIYIVDGKYIRTNINEEFTNFGQHYHFKFIPKGEFWIDKEYHHGNEIHYFIDHLLLENRLMAKGHNYIEALDRADALERSERRKSKLLKKYKHNPIKHVHEKLFKKYCKDVNVWLVNGELVRDKYFIDFTEGGHDLVYHFIPKNEIWIDSDVNPKEMKYVLLHELHERNLMVNMLKRKVKKNRSGMYLTAHHSASNIEYFCRHHPKELDKVLKEELKKC